MQEDAERRQGTPHGGRAMVSVRACFVGSRGDKRGTRQSSRTYPTRWATKFEKHGAFERGQAKVLVLDSSFRK